MKHLALVLSGVLAVFASTFALAQRSALPAASSDSAPAVRPAPAQVLAPAPVSAPLIIASTAIVVTLRLSRDETWAYDIDTGAVTSLGSQSSATINLPLSPIAQDATSPIRGVGIVVKKNCPNCTYTDRAVGPASQPAAGAITDGASTVPQDAVKPIRGVGVVVKRNPGSSAERTMATDADGAATSTDDLLPGSYDVTVTIPADALSDAPSNASRNSATARSTSQARPTPSAGARNLLFKVIVGEDLTATSSYCASPTGVCRPY